MGGSDLRAWRKLNENNFVPVRRAFELHVADDWPISDAVALTVTGVPQRNHFEHGNAFARGLLNENGARHITEACDRPLKAMGEQ